MIASEAPAEAPALDRAGTCQKPLSLAAARHLEQQAWAVVPQTFQDLVSRGRPVLMDVACSENSLLTRTIQDRTGDPDAASRCSLWNACDLATNAGVQLILDRLQVEQPTHVWISPPCGPFSPLQQVNQRTEAQKQELHNKRQHAIRMYAGASCVFQRCLQLGIHATWELAEKSQAWRLPVLSLIHI